MKNDAAIKMLESFRRTEAALLCNYEKSERLLRYINSVSTWVPTEYIESMVRVAETACEVVRQALYLLDQEKLGASDAFLETEGKLKTMECNLEALRGYASVGMLALAKLFDILSTMQNIIAVVEMAVIGEIAKE